MSEDKINKADRSVYIQYRNHRGITSWRHVLPLVWDFTSSPWHSEQQWIMLALDLDRGFDREGERVQRSFALQNILVWQYEPPPRPSEREGIPRWPG